MKDADYDESHADASIDSWYAVQLLKGHVAKSREVFGISNSRGGVLFDGENGQIDGYRFEESDNVTSYKGSAACTSARQPMDRAKSFWNMKSKERHRKHRDKALSKEDEAKLESKLKSHGVKMRSGHKKLLKQFLGRLPYLLSSSLRVDLVEDGWNKSGLYPYNFTTMSSTCPAWKDIRPMERARIESLFPVFYNEFKDKGKIPETFFDLHGIPEDKRGNRGNESQCTNRHRAEVLPPVDELSSSSELIDGSGESSDSESDSEPEEKSVAEEELSTTPPVAPVVSAPPPSSSSRNDDDVRSMGDTNATNDQPPGVSLRRSTRSRQTRTVPGSVILSSFLEDYLLDVSVPLSGSAV